MGSSFCLRGPPGPPPPRGLLPKNQHRVRERKWAGLPGYMTGAKSSSLLLSIKCFDQGGNCRMCSLKQFWHSRKNIMANHLTNYYNNAQCAKPYNIRHNISPHVHLQHHMLRDTEKEKKYTNMTKYTHHKPKLPCTGQVHLSTQSLLAYVKGFIQYDKREL